MLKYLSPLMLVIACCASSYAADLPKEPAPYDFAYGIQMSVEGSGAAAYINLPESVYQKACREDLGDIRVFNSAGEAVPFMIKRPEMAATPRPGIQVPFFPLYGQVEKKTDMKGGVSFYINTDKSGAIVDVRSDSLDQKGKKICAYLFDLSQIDEAPGGLEFQWSQPKENFNIPVLIEGSYDLRSWQTVVNRESIAELNFSGHALFKNKISLPAAKNRYLRLTWPPEAEDVILTGVKAVFSDKPEDYPRLWLSASGNKIDGKIAAYEFNSGGVFPVDRVNIELPEPNTLIQVILQSRANGKEIWREQYRGLFYRLNMNDVELSNDTVAIQPDADRCWRMEVVSEGSSFGANVPKLKLGWIQFRLLFLMRGSQPFTLAYGSVSVSPPRYAVDNLFSKIRDTKSINIVQAEIRGDPVVLGGPDRLNPAPPPLPWKKWVLWGILALSVAILAGMAIRLFRQMNT